MVPLVVLAVTALERVRRADTHLQEHPRVSHSLYHCLMMQSLVWLFLCTSKHNTSERSDSPEGSRTQPAPFTLKGQKGPLIILVLQKTTPISR